MMSGQTADLTIIILTFNEAVHIARALDSTTKLSVRCVVIDSFSTDATVSIARAMGAEVVQHAFLNYADQFQWAIDNVPITTDWVMRLDADEELTESLVEEMGDRLAALPLDVTGINLNRQHIFLGRWIKHGGRYPLTLLRIWRNGAARIEQRWMDEHMVLIHGQTVTFKHDFRDVNLKDITYFVEKHNQYATREAIDVLIARYSLTSQDSGVCNGDSSAQAYIKRNFKLNLYNKLPFWLGPLLYFLYRYLFQFGFVDGWQGSIYHILQGFWYRFLVGVKVREYDNVLRAIDDPEKQLEALRSLTGKSC